MSRKKPYTVPTDAIEQDRLTAKVLEIFHPNAEFDRKRSNDNSELLGLLTQFLTDYPHMRFGQALSNLNLITEDCALVEPCTQLKRVKTAIRSIKRAR